MSYEFNQYQLETEINEFLQNNDILPKNGSLTGIQFDGMIHRFAVAEDKRGEETGWYVLFNDGWPAGAVGDWRKGIEAKWSFNRANLDDEGKKFFDTRKYNAAVKRAEARRTQIRQEIAEKQSRKATHALDYFSQLPKNVPITFSYLIKKDILPVGDIRYDKKKNALAIPLYDVNRVYKSTQWIYPDGTKRYEPDTSKKGAFFIVDANPDNLKKAELIFIGEGVATMETVYALAECKVPCVAAMDCGNLFEVTQSIKQKYPKAKIIIIADNDRKTKGNPGLTAAENVKEKLKITGIITPKFKHVEKGSDWNDYYANHGESETRAVFMKELKLLLMPPEKRRIYERVESINGYDLFYKEFEPIKWAVQDFIPSGLTILAGGPKVGKSILALQLAVSVSLGGCALGKIPVQQGDVLYLALEDTQRRIKERIVSANPDLTEEERKQLAHLTIDTRVPRQNEGGLERIRDWLDEHENARLVIIDTLQMFRKKFDSKKSMYSEDYDVVSEIKKLADEYNIAIILIHHLKKAMSDDWLNEISGSQGIAGAADTILSLKRSRTENEGILHRTGRDVEETDFMIELDYFSWVLKGEANNLNVSDWEKKIIEYLQTHNSITPVDLSNFANITIDAAQKNLQRCLKSGNIVRISRGSYGLADYQR